MNNQNQQQELIQQHINQIVNSLHQAYGGVSGELIQKLAMERVRNNDLEMMLQTRDAQIEELEAQVKELSKEDKKKD